MKNVAAEGPRLVLYADEFTPGNALRPVVEMRAVYYTFENFPEWWRCRQEGWMTLGCLRTQKIEELECGMSTLMVAILDIFFNGRFPLDVGITLKSQGEDFTLRIPRVSTVVADFKQFQQFYKSMGAGGALPCFLCMNVVQEHGERSLGVQDRPSLVKMQDATIERCKPHSARTIWVLCDLLSQASATMGSTRFRTLQQAAGFNFAPKSLLWCRRLGKYLDPVDTAYIDIGHTVPCGGRRSGAVWQAVAPLGDPVNHAS